MQAGSFGVRATLKVPRGFLANGRQIHRLRIPNMKKARHDSNECKLHLRLAPSPVSIVLTKALLQSVVFQGATRAIDSFLDVYLSAKVALRTLMLVFDNGRRHRRARRILDNHVAVVWHARLLAAGGTCGSNSLPSNRLNIGPQYQPESELECKYGFMELPFDDQSTEHNTTKTQISEPSESG